MPTTTEYAAEVRAEPGPSGDVTFRIRPALDARSGKLLLDAVRTAAVRSTAGYTRITVDLSGIDRFTDEGVTAAVRCCRLGADLPRGVTFVANAGASREALLAILDER